MLCTLQSQCELIRARPHPKPAGRKSAAESREEHPADLHAGRFARRAQARVASERPASEFHPEPSRGRRRRDGGARKASPRRRPRPAARAAGPWPKRGRPAPSEAKRSEGQRSGAAAPRVKAARRPRQRGERKVGRTGGRGAGGGAGPRKRGRRRHGGKRGQWGERKVGAMGA